MFESLLDYYILTIIIVKIIFLFCILKLSYYRLFNSNDEEMIKNLQTKKEQIDWYFLTLTFILMIYLFNLRFKSSVVIDGHTKIILFACGVIGLIHQLQNKFKF